MYNLSQKLGSMEYDNLISDLTPQPQVRAGTLAHGGEEISLKRGTILEKDGSGKLHILGTKPNGSVTEDFNGDGATTTFTLAANPLPLAVKGAKVGTADAVIDSYNAQTGVVTLHAAPAAGTKNVHITYEAADANEPYGILCDDVTVGTAADETVPIYTAGCFNTNKVIAKEGYTITDADFDALRRYGIVFKAASAAR